MYPWILAAWIGCQVFDQTSTAVNLRDPRIYEANPIMRGTRGYALKISVNIAAIVWQRQTFHGPRATAKARYVMPLIMAGAGCLAGAQNIQTARAVSRVGAP